MAILFRSDSNSSVFQVLWKLYRMLTKPDSTMRLNANISTAFHHLLSFNSSYLLGNIRSSTPLSTSIWTFAWTAGVRWWKYIWRKIRSIVKSRRERRERVAREAWQKVNERKRRQGRGRGRRWLGIRWMGWWSQSLRVGRWGLSHLIQSFGRMEFVGRR